MGVTPSKSNTAAFASASSYGIFIQACHCLGEYDGIRTRDYYGHSVVSDASDSHSMSSLADCLFTCQPLLGQVFHPVAIHPNPWGVVSVLHDTVLPSHALGVSLDQFYRPAVSALSSPTLRLTSLVYHTGAGPVKSLQTVPERRCYGRRT